MDSSSAEIDSMHIYNQAMVSPNKIREVKDPKGTPVETINTRFQPSSIYAGVDFQNVRETKKNRPVRGKQGENTIILRRTKHQVGEGNHEKHKSSQVLSQIFK